jgi:hypothetical protein
MVMQSYTLSHSTVPEFKSRKSLFYKKNNVLWPIMTPIDHSSADPFTSLLRETPWGLCLPTHASLTVFSLHLTIAAD